MENTSNSKELSDIIPSLVTREMFNFLLQSKTPLFQPEIFESLKDENDVVKRDVLLHHTLRTDVFLTHDWGFDILGRNNHSRVAKINEALKARGILTWFDNDRMEGNIVQKMCDGIDKTSLALVFVTQRYIEKVNHPHGNDNCQLEFNYALQRITPSRMIPVVQESRCLNQRTWDGPVGMALGTSMFIDNTSDEDLESTVDDIYKVIIRKLQQPPLLHSLPPLPALRLTPATAPSSSSAPLKQLSLREIEALMKYIGLEAAFDDLIHSEILTGSTLQIFIELCSSLSTDKVLTLFEAMEALPGSDVRLFLTGLQSVQQQGVGALEDMRAQGFYHSLSESVDEDDCASVRSTASHLSNEAEDEEVDDEGLGSAREAEYKAFLEQEILPLLTSEARMHSIFFHVVQAVMQLLSNWAEYESQYEHHTTSEHYLSLRSFFLALLQDKECVVLLDKDCALTGAQFLQSIEAVSLKIKALQRRCHRRERRAAKKKDYLAANRWKEIADNLQHYSEEVAEDHLSLPQLIEAKHYDQYHLASFTEHLNLFHLIFHTADVIALPVDTRHTSSFTSSWSLYSMMRHLHLLEVWGACHDALLKECSNEVTPSECSGVSFDIQQLLDLSFQPSELLDFHYFHLTELRAHPGALQEVVRQGRVHLSDLRNAQYTIEELTSPPLRCFTLEELLTSDVYSRYDIIAMRCSVAFALAHGFTLSELRAAGQYSLTDFLKADVMISDLLLTLHYSVAEILETRHYTQDDLKLAICGMPYACLPTPLKAELKVVLGFTARELKEVFQASARDMLSVMCYDVIDLIVSGRYRAEELLQAMEGVSREELDRYELFSLDSLRAAHVSADLLLSRGFNEEELRGAGILPPLPVEKEEEEVTSFVFQSEYVSVEEEVEEEEKSLVNHSEYVSMTVESEEEREEEQAAVVITTITTTTTTTLITTTEEEEEVLSPQVSVEAVKEVEEVVVEVEQEGKADVTAVINEESQKEKEVTIVIAEVTHTTEEVIEEEDFSNDVIASEEITTITTTTTYYNTTNKEEEEVNDVEEEDCNVTDDLPVEEECSEEVAEVVEHIVTTITTTIAITDSDVNENEEEAHVIVVDEGVSEEVVIEVEISSADVIIQENEDEEVVEDVSAVSDVAIIEEEKEETVLVLEEEVEESENTVNTTSITTITTSTTALTTNNEEEKEVTATIEEEEEDIVTSA
eukprot:CAMPEP_0173141388 /NCGR_PEP_ID=MMETSP1105-20130129/5467_1 /TAXON_ID=2985 /ORGANISM="Ochromonas sp., Strain BG-1" /LENGTH=1200 /DNA_ID=CAMNT_0014054587 /DNA_START=163 /DNA_END=3761 /DNA_ORIENTATION=+